MEHETYQGVVAGRLWEKNHVYPKFTAKEDTTFWWPNKFGEYDVKSAYNLMHNYCVPSREKLHLFTKIWKLNLPQKIRFFMWQFTHQLLPTADLLCDRGFHVDTVCSLCLAAEESPQHIFLQCPFARAVWLGLGLSVSISYFDFMNMKDRLQQMLKCLGNADAEMLRKC
ncbi:hypothetical protein IFM89_027807 [Coptis chinensis]|uniref:Reverse transcriptase zinc-binding domain-containing protein n=1 Tax=Coptis chinensis TaxID=261450 RepID=A0A835IYA4_9MAGN|nr:hypothetical protein IFM89_027807 [Coptis chinensis]